MVSFERRGLGEALHQGGLTVPRYQREYKWLAENVQALFDDVEAAIDDQQSEYFVGTVVVAKQNTKSPDIVDGQQRLATTAIFFSAVRDYFFESGANEDAFDIQRDYLLVRDRRTGEQIPKLRLSERDHGFFEDTILKPLDSPTRNTAPTHPSHERLRSAQELASRYVRKIVDRKGDAHKHLEDRIEFFKSQLGVIWVGVPDEANAFAIFETLNDRGLDLATTDLVKNYLFGKAGKRIDEVQQHWLTMYARLESALNKEEQITDFLRHQWASIHGLTRDKELFSAIKSEVNSVTRSLAYSKQLQDDSRLYEALVTINDAYWRSWGVGVQRDLRALNDLKMERIRPLLLAVLSTFKREEVKKSFSLFVSWGVRLLVAPSVAGTLERFYSETAKKVRSNSINSATQLLAAAKGVVPTDDDFRDYFAKADVGNSKQARYLLQELEIVAATKRGMRPEDDAQVANLEHILPRNPTASEWKTFDPELFDYYSSRLGNLCLLLEEENNRLRNDEFQSKKKIYKDSVFKLTAQVAEFGEWTRESIDERQRALAELALKRWVNSVK